MVAILMMSAKLATTGSFERKVFSNKGYHVTISAHDVMTNVDMFM